MNKKVLFLLVLTLFAFASTAATATMALNMTTPNAFGITKSIVGTTGSGDTQPTGGDPVDDPVMPC